MMPSSEVFSVLIVDDHPMVREGLAGIYTRHGIKVAGQASCGAQAIELFAAHRPDVVLLDLRLPDIGGIDVLHALLEIDKAARVIILTSAQGDASVYEAIRAGASGYLLKGIEGAALVEQTRRVVAGRKALSDETTEKLATFVSSRKLTEREIEVLELISQGKSNKEAAQLLFVTVTISMTPSSTTSVVGASTKFDISVQAVKVVSSGAVPTGTVSLHTDDGAQTQALPLIGGHASTFIPWNGAGSLTVTAEYDGDTNYGGGNSGFVTINVVKATPTLQMHTLSPYVATGTQTSVQAIIVDPYSAAQAAAPTGMVQFYDSVNGGASTSIGAPQPINVGNGNVLIATVAPVLAAGTHALTAIYAGDSNWNAATAALAVQVVVTTPDFVATATPNPLSLTAGGSATLQIGTQSILGFSDTVNIACTGTLPQGVTCGSATIQAGASGGLTVSSVGPGTTTTSSAKRGGAPWMPVGGSLCVAALCLLLPRRRRWMQVLPLAFVAVLLGTFAGCGGSSAKATSMSLSSSSTKVASGQSVTFVATITTSRDVKGTVSFYDGSTAIASTIPVTKGVATFSTTSLTVGTHAITAKYSGDSNTLASASSDVLQQTITGQFTLSVNATAGTTVHSLNVPVTLQ